MRFAGARLRPTRPRGVFIAAGVGAVIVVVIALALFLPLVGVLAAATASSAGLIPFPALGVTLVTLLGVVLVAGALLLAGLRRRVGPAWALSTVAVLIALGVTAYPLIAVVAGSADRAADVGPVIADIWQRVAG